MLQRQAQEAVRISRYELEAHFTVSPSCFLPCLEVLVTRLILWQNANYGYRILAGDRLMIALHFLTAGKQKFVKLGK